MKRIVAATFMILFGVATVGYGVKVLSQPSAVLPWDLSVAFSGLAIIITGITVLFGAKIRDAIESLFS